MNVAGKNIKIDPSEAAFDDFIGGTDDVIDGTDDG
jgi:hypothetical protein